jgi:hypothetical protein
MPQRDRFAHTTPYGNSGTGLSEAADRGACRAGKGNCLRIEISDAGLRGGTEAPLTKGRLVDSVEVERSGIGALRDTVVGGPTRPWMAAPPV